MHAQGRILLLFATRAVSAPPGEEMEEEGKFTFPPPAVPSQRLEPNRNIVFRNELTDDTYFGKKPSAPKS